MSRKLLLAAVLFFITSLSLFAPDEEGLLLSTYPEYSDVIDELEDQGAALIAFKREFDRRMIVRRSLVNHCQAVLEGTNLYGLRDCVRELAVIHDEMEKNIRTRLALARSVNTLVDSLHPDDVPEVIEGKNLAEEVIGVTMDLHNLTELLEGDDALINTIIARCLEWESENGARLEIEAEGSLQAAHDNALVADAFPGLQEVVQASLTQAIIQPRAQDDAEAKEFLAQGKAHIAQVISNLGLPTSKKALSKARCAVCRKFLLKGRKAKNKVIPDTLCLPFYCDHFEPLEGLTGRKLRQGVKNKQASILPHAMHATCATGVLLNTDSCPMCREKELWKSPVIESDLAVADVAGE